MVINNPETALDSQARPAPIHYLDAASLLLAECGAEQTGAEGAGPADHPSLAARHRPELHGLRGLAIALVVSFHEINIKRIDTSADLIGLIVTTFALMFIFRWLRVLSAAR